MLSAALRLAMLLALLLLGLRSLLPVEKLMIMHERVGVGWVAASLQLPLQKGCATA